MNDIRDEIFKNIGHKKFTAKIIAAAAGVISGTVDAIKEAENLKLKILQWIKDKSPVKKGDVIARFSGTPKQIVMAEELIMGHMSKFSGISTAAKRFVAKCGDRPKVVSGSWKKMPIGLKGKIRSAVAAGDAAIRISDTPFIYLDKNYVKMLGGITSSLRATECMRDRKRVIQIHGHFNDIASEACEAVQNGADIVFIDTGEIDDAREVLAALGENRLRHQVKIVFAGDISFEDLDQLKQLDLDFLDVGRAIVDAPLLDMRMVVEDN
jgi:nicotinate-nucleotide pyrophosphorylase (carboxylating)